ncbi:RNA exonuclease 1 homolog isoform X2 [Clinocottus analis]|uniref:RNA exonuclease 1 homolog isoform X2 n=1 Tax=Clinocottus analis TaxID=304258 RepID=UPI0035C0F262
MFPSSGLFASISCPFSKRGLCERPYCLYKHAKGMRDVFGASCHSSTFEFAGEQTGYRSNDETKDDSLQELERINKEIETVRYEVEQEQRRLSRCQTVLADGVKTAPNYSVSKSETGGKNVDGGYGLTSRTDSTQTFSQARMYVVDNSKPRTDLEYDPLSNFSAGLRSCSSSGKKQKVKTAHGLKTAKNAVPCDQKKPVAHQSELSRSSSPEPLDDSNEDCVLIIDVPPSPDKKRAKALKSVDFLAGKSLRERLEEVKTEPVLLLNADTYEASTLPSSKFEKNKDVEGLFNLYESKECTNVPADGSAGNLTVHLEDVQSKSQKNDQFLAEKIVEQTPESAIPPATTDQRDNNCNNLLVEKDKLRFQVAFPQCDPCVGKMNPHHFPPTNSLFYEAPEANSSLQCRQHGKQVQTAEQLAQDRDSSQWSSVLPQRRNTSSKMQGWSQGEAAAPESDPVPGEPLSVHSSASSLAIGADLASVSTGQLCMTEDDEVVVIESSSDEDKLNYSEIELSDDDPMEECYRIFMEANEEQQPDMSVDAMDVEKPKLNVKPQAPLGRKRVAHDAKHTEQPSVKSRPQPQVLVPLRAPAVSGFASQPSITSKIQQVQQRASMLTTSVKGGQAFVVSSTGQRKPEIQSASFPSAQTPVNLQPAPVQNAHMNYISLGTAVIGADNNLHLILPEGIFPLPVTSSSSQVTSVLTPIGQVHTGSVAMRQMYHPPAVMPLQRYRTTAPVLIPAPSRKPSMASACASSHSSPVAFAAPQAAVHTKPVPTKRKLKQCEAAKEKVPHEIRQRYVNMFTEEFLKTTPNVNDAFEKALAEEKVVYNRSVNKLKYLSVAVNAVKRLKNQSAVTAKDENEDKSQRSKGNISLNLKLKGNDDMALYESLRDHILTEERLVESNYPVQHPEKPGSCVLFIDCKKGSADPLKRICCRCGSTYSVNQMGKHVRKEECNYHYGKGVTEKVPGGVETRYSCCEAVMGAPGCQVFQVHVHDFISLDGFVSTGPRHPSDTSCPGVYSLDCETCYTIHGLELSRVTVVNSSVQVVYDTFVRPDNEVIDYNTRFSGISEEDVKGNRTSLREVQDTLLSFVSADTILIGHGLETDLCALKIFLFSVVAPWDGDRHLGGFPSPPGPPSQADPQQPQC